MIAKSDKKYIDAIEKLTDTKIEWLELETSKTVSDEGDGAKAKPARKPRSSDGVVLADHLTAAPLQHRRY